MLLFSTDIDGTIYDGDETASHFRDFWMSLKKYHDPNARLVFNTGRSVEDVQQLLTSVPLPSPDYIIGGVGTAILELHTNQILSAWKETITNGWDFGSVQQLIAENAAGIEPQPPECQSEVKCSWYWRDQPEERISELEAQLHENGLAVQLIYSSDRDLDAIPQMANKGNAIEWLADFLGVENSDTVVAGDSGNDSSMFKMNDSRGIIVSNAAEDLKKIRDPHRHFLAESPCAFGVTAGLDYFLKQ